MGFLNKSTITVDAILTKKGREKLAAGNFDITKFAVADDDIDYNLYDINHTKGSNFYGQAIEAMPLTEAVPDGGKSMRYKLMTLPKNITTIPYGQAQPAEATIVINGPVQESLNITLFNIGSQAGQITATISDIDVAYFIGENGQPTSVYNSGTSAANNTGQQVTFVGRSLFNTQTTTLTVVHEGTGLTFQKTLSVTRDPQYQVT